MDLMAEVIADDVPVCSVFSRPVAMVFEIDVFADRLALDRAISAAFSSFSAAFSLFSAAVTPL